MTTIRTFVVSGTGDFPFEMLMVDCCWPASTADAEHLRPRPWHYGRARQITLYSRSHYISRALWRTRGWEVIVDVGWTMNSAELRHATQKALRTAAAKTEQ